MKKYIYLLLATLVTLQLIGCGGASGGVKDEGGAENNTTPVTTTTLPSIACPTNSVTPFAASLEACTSTPGYYDCNSGTCKDVGAGYYSVGGENTKIQCPSGTYSTGLNNSACTGCAGGTFQSVAGQTSCDVCTNTPTNAISFNYSVFDLSLTSNSCNYQSIICNGGYYFNGSTSCVACTNTVSNATSVTYDLAQTGLTANNCPIFDVTCSQYYTKSGVSCIANTVDAPSGATRTPAASVTTNSSTVTVTVDSNTTNLTLYSDSGCTAQIGAGTAAQAASGITITGLTDQTTNVYGKATNSVTGQESACTSLTTFKYWPSDTFTATYTNTNPLVACDGTQNVTQNLTSCIGDNTGISDNSKCATTSSVSMQSPAGTKDVVITNGTRHDTCALGSSIASTQSVTCNSSYVDFNLTCVPEPTLTLIRDINSGAGNSYPSYFTGDGNGSYFFQASNGADGYELWKTDGTLGGTSMVKNINPSGDSSPFSLSSNGNGGIFFGASDGTNGYEPWITDGTSGGTNMVKSLRTGSNNGMDQFSYKLIALHSTNWVVLAGDDGGGGKQLYLSNGTSGGTTIIKPYASDGPMTPQYLAQLSNGVIIFAANNFFTGNYGQELWITNGSSGGTYVLKDIYPGSTGSYPRRMQYVGNGKIMFYANDGTNGYELWITDGTSGGTYLVKNINPSGDSFIYNGEENAFGVLGDGRIVFAANDGTNGYELWITDGTSGGTYLVKNIYSGSSSSLPGSFESLDNGKVIFAADNGVNGKELWITDGTSGGTKMIMDYYPGSTGSYPFWMKNIGGGKVLLGATNSSSGAELHLFRYYDY